MNTITNIYLTPTRAQPDGSDGQKRKVSEDLNSRPSKKQKVEKKKKDQREPKLILKNLSNRMPEEAFKEAVKDCGMRLWINS
jgi:hypothetical protein